MRLTTIQWGALCCLLFAGVTNAATCTATKYRPNHIIEVSSALSVGTRVSLPGNLITKPVTSNALLWDVDAMPGTNSILIKPNSKLDEGARTSIYAYTDDGNIYDIVAHRTSVNKASPCVIVSDDNHYYSESQKQALGQFMSSKRLSEGGQSARIAQLETALNDQTARTEQVRKQAVVEALKKYRYRIYTRYQWDEGKAFVGHNTISDVYDDGQFTYIRLANPNRGILSVETQIGGKNAVAPVKYEDAYAMYRVTGIYPNFTLRIDDVTLSVTRSDNQTRGNL
ncbi:TrbG/VirB9 family P-type conjugative transfer protein [Vibrio maritimus]|uniref:TrbG/VirB9 family P-type conjugative transfer protein n=1 Tax=Vibrio maritimus TaxID=990268 RepID=UPI001F359869|nr:TrbG/VirB9 family P-type conjugative transfer protein [Vibrio maritimus]